MHYLCFDCALSMAEGEIDAPEEIPELFEGTCPVCGEIGPDDTEEVTEETSCAAGGDS